MVHGLCRKAGRDRRVGVDRVEDLLRAPAAFRIADFVDQADVPGFLCMDDFARQDELQGAALATSRGRRGAPP